MSYAAYVNFLSFIFTVYISEDFCVFLLLFFSLYKTTAISTFFLHYSHISYIFDTSCYSFTDFLLASWYCPKLGTVLQALLVHNRRIISHILKIKFSFICPSMTFASICNNTISLSHSVVIHNPRFFSITRNCLYLCFQLFLNVGNSFPNF